ncbi:MAG TPA: glycosyltransferase family 2 protein [Polyangiaceae bacterium]|nr:glycosyltransferase family 2 protein [Polyangiaceae bacterium]
MFHQHRVFVIVPAYCEQRLIQATIRSIPALVDAIIVVDDGSTDSTQAKVVELADERTHLIAHDHNQGVGAAIYTGYAAAIAMGADILVVMAGDNQMDGSDLEPLLRPLLIGSGYVKGNRFLHPQVKHMPRLRRWGSRLLGYFTSWATGVRIDDSQCGYTAITRQAVLSLDLSRMWTGYGYPNDLLIALARRGVAIAQVPVRPVYAGEASGLRPWHLLTICTVILRRWWRERHVQSSMAERYSKEQLMG